PSAGGQPPTAPGRAATTRDAGGLSEGLRRSGEDSHGLILHPGERAILSSWLLAAPGLLTGALTRGCWSFPAGRGVLRTPMVRSWQRRVGLTRGRLDPGLALLILWTTFIVYGTMLPFRFHLDAAEAARTLRALGGSFGRPISRTDAVSNVLLFM